MFEREDEDRYAEYDEMDVPARRPKGHGKARRQGTLTDLVVYGRNRREGAMNTLRKLRRS